MLLLDAGGLFGPRSKLEREQTRFVCEVTAGFGYDAIGLGHQDLNYGLDFLREMIALHHLPFTSANVRDTVSGEPILPPYLIVRKDSQVFGIVSVLDPAEKFISMSARDEALRIDDPVATLRLLVPQIRREAKTVVLLSHFDVPKTEELLKEIEGVDIAVVGHTHQALPGERVVGRSIMLAAGYEGRAVGRLNGSFDDEGVVRAFNVQMTDLDEKIINDQAMDAQVETFKLRLEEIRLTLRGKHQPVKGSDREQFLSQRECRKCHADIFAKLEMSRHNSAFTALIQKGMSQEPECLVCHVTGYEHRNGYDERPPYSSLINVQCEACHGYGTLHRRDSRWKKEARGTCAECHDQKNSPNFDFATYWEKIRH